MSFCYCMGGFQSKKTAFSFYLTGQKRVNRSIQSIFLYIYTVYVLLFCIFSAYMQFNLKRMTNHSAESGKSFSACRFVFLFQTPENVFFRQNSGLQTACRIYLAAFSVPKSGNIMQAGCVFKLTRRATSCGRKGMNGWQRINILAHELSFCYSWRAVWLRYSCPKRYLCANTRFLRMRKWHRVKVSTACRNGL